MIFEQRFFARRSESILITSSPQSTPEPGMPVVVACRCGQRFAANEQLIGQQVPCPACGNLLAIGRPIGTGQGIYVSCRCGRAFSAPKSLRGRETRCPGCGGVIRVPGDTDPLGGGLLDAGDMLGGLGPARPLA